MAKTYSKTVFGAGNNTWEGVDQGYDPCAEPIGRVQTLLDVEVANAQLCKRKGYEKVYHQHKFGYLNIGNTSFAGDDRIFSHTDVGDVRLISGLIDIVPAESTSSADFSSQSSSSSSSSSLGFSSSSSLGFSSSSSSSLGYSESSSSSSLRYSSSSTSNFTPTWTSQYPPSQSTTYVKATTTYDMVNYPPWFTTDPSKSLTGDGYPNTWLTSYGANTNQRFHIDLGTAKKINRIYYENAHWSGSFTERGAKNFAFYGSNSFSTASLPVVGSVSNTRALVSAMLIGVPEGV